MARKLTVVPPNVAKKMVAQYANGRGLLYLAGQFSVGAIIVRRTLAANGVTIRGRGRPAK